jgi:mannose-6-phosphate isomerase
VPGEFPLLVKLIGPARWLSVQVHPSDSREPGRGKAEAWLVLEAPPGAEVIYGVRSGENLAQALAQGGAELALQRLPVFVGDCIIIPPGTVHALGPGILVYEVQQPRDVTYRLWDWDRVDEDGRARPLQMQQGLAALAPAGPGKVAGIDVSSGRTRRVRWTIDPWFSLEQLWVRDGYTQRPAPAFSVWTVAAGQGRLLSPHRSFDLTRGQSFLSPAGSRWHFEGQASLLRASGPQNP